MKELAPLGIKAMVVQPGALEQDSMMVNLYKEQKLKLVIMKQS
ncbi:MAG: hypothetical protein ACLR43_07140 [Faecalibacillus faecis]